MGHWQNIVRIKSVYHLLGPLKNEVVFVGGATVSLYATQVTEDIRPTDDVDVLIEIADYKGYAELEKQLLSLGFANDTESGVICRYKVQGITVDIMPTNEDAIGFSNRWYPDGFKTAIPQMLDDRVFVKIFTPAHFMATKLEAFRNRGHHDGRQSSDFEDIVFVLNNRPAIWEEMAAAPQELFQYLKSTWNSLLNNAYLYEWIESHLEFSQQGHAKMIIENLKVTFR